MKNIKSILLIIGSILFLACEKETVDPLLQYLEDGEEFSGGNGTTFLMSGDAFGQAISGLTDAQENSFFVGNSLFNQNWVTAPASTTARDGLGPFFNARSCSGCHCWRLTLRCKRMIRNQSCDRRKDRFRLTASRR